jgi:exonuclease-1
MRALFTKNIEFIVSPYESDSQMAKLVKLGIADVVITEDSDLIIYGVSVILKLNQDGECDYVNLNQWKP